MPNGIIRDPVQNNAQQNDPVTEDINSPRFRDYGFLEGEDMHLLLYIKDETSWPLIAGTTVKYETETITFDHDGKSLQIDIALITEEIESPYVSAINRRVKRNIGKPNEKKDHYKKKIPRSELRDKKIKD
jgi:hypothetical protein